MAEDSDRPNEGRVRVKQTFGSPRILTFSVACYETRTENLGRWKREGKKGLNNCTTQCLQWIHEVKIQTMSVLSEFKSEPCRLSQSGSNP